MLLSIISILQVRTPRHEVVSDWPKITELTNDRKGTAPADWGSRTPVSVHYITTALLPLEHTNIYGMAHQGQGFLPRGRMTLLTKASSS